MKAKYLIYTYNGAKHEFYKDAPNKREAAKACREAKTKEMNSHPDTCPARQAVMSYAVKSDAPQYVRFLSYSFGVMYHKHDTANPTNPEEETTAGLEALFERGLKALKD